MVTVVSTVPHKSVVKEAICGECGATLHYVPKDVEARRVSHGGDIDTEYFIKCPACGYDSVHARRY